MTLSPVPVSRYPHADNRNSTDCRIVTVPVQGVGQTPEPDGTQTPSGYLVDTGTQETGADIDYDKKRNTSLSSYQYLYCTK